MPKNTPERIIDARTTPSGVVVAYANGGGGGGGGGSGYVPLARQIVAGAGLTGGGPLIADVTLDVGAGEGLVANADNLALSPSVAGAGLAYSAGVLSVGLGEGLEFEGDAIGLKADIAGAGLGYSAGVLSVGVAGLGLTVETDLVRLTSSSNPGAAAAILATDGSGGVSLARLTIPTLGALYMDGTLDFGSDTLYEDASYLQVAGSKPVRFGQNIGGANWTVYSAGGANFTGNLDITSGGDLTVGNNVLLVDVSQNNVGIGGVPVGWPVGAPWPDPQFALDVSGPLRATYIVGKLAVQLPDAAMICHYDGRAPYETNFTGDLNGHMGQVGKATGGVIFRIGKFYKAVQLAPAATNLVTNPSFEVNTTGWTTILSGGTGGALARDTSRAYVGGASAKLTASTGGSFGIRSSGVSVPNGSSISVHCRIRRDGAAGATVQIRDTTNSATRATATPAQTGTWERVTATWTNSTGAAATVELRILNTAGDGAANIWVDACQMELSAYPTPYCDGSLGGYSAAGVQDGSGHAWTGTAHASASTRAAAALSYPTAGNINPLKWTIMCWVMPMGLTGANQEIVRIAGDTAGYIILRLDSTGKPQAFGGTTGVSGTAALTPGVWAHLAATYDGTTVRVFANGVQVGSVASSGFAGLPALMYVGCASAAGANAFNGSMDDLGILAYAADPNLLRTIYESDAPIFAETSGYVFRATPQGLIRGDDEGLWIRDTLGNPVLGIYGGEAATKTWAGWTDMAVGDVIIGRNVAGASALRWTQATGKFGFFGGGNPAPQVEIGTDGSLYVGSPTAARIQMTATELAGYNGANQKQWFGDATDGKLYSAGKNVSLAADGIRIKMDDTVLNGWNEIRWDAKTSGYGFFEMYAHTIVGAGNPRVRGVLSAIPENSADFAEIRLSATGGGVAGGGRVILFGSVGIKQNAPQAALHVSGGVLVEGDDGGVAGAVGLTNAYSVIVGTGIGTVKLAGTTARNSDAWIKVYVGTTAYWIPAWSNIS